MRKSSGSMPSSGEILPQRHVKYAANVPDFSNAQNVHRAVDHAHQQGIAPGVGTMGQGDFFRQRAPQVVQNRIFSRAWSIVSASCFSPPPIGLDDVQRERSRNAARCRAACSAQR